MKALILLFNFIFFIPIDAQQIQLNIATYSIVARDSITGDLGIAVQSKSLAVGALVPYAKASIGAIAIQGWANTNYGPQAMDMISGGSTAQQVSDFLIQNDKDANHLQIGLVDAKGNVAAYTGSNCEYWAGHITGKGYTVQGNFLASEEVLKVMARMFEITPGNLTDRLIAALEAGQTAGGDKRGRQSAALLIVREKGGFGGYNDRFVDIRVDDDSLPLTELKRIYRLWKDTYLMDAQMRSIDEFTKKKNYLGADYVKREVVDLLNSSLRDKPDDVDLLNRVAWMLAIYNIDRERALELAKRAVKLSPNNFNILHTLAECHFQLRHYDEAIAIATELVEKDPTNDELWKQLQRFKEAKAKAGE